MKRHPLTTLLTAALVATSPSLCLAKEAPFTSTELIRVDEEAKHAQQRFFELTRIAQPLCPAHSGWSYGPGYQLVPKEEWRSADARARREALLGEFKDAGELDLILSTEPPPHSLLHSAGHQRGDRILFTEPSASESAPADENREQRLARLKREAEIRFGQNPWNDLQVQRNGQTVTLRTEMVRACQYSLKVVNAPTTYTYASWGMATISRPLLLKLTDEDLTLALAFEVAFIASGFTELSKSGFTNMLISGLALWGAGVVNSSYESTSKFRGTPDPDSLIQIDRLALMLVEPYGLGPLEYRRFLEAMREDRPSRFYMGTTHHGLRQISDARLEALDELHEQRKSGAPWVRPIYVEEAEFQAFQRQLPDIGSRIPSIALHSRQKP